MRCHKPIIDFLVEVEARHRRQGGCLLRIAPAAERVLLAHEHVPRLLLDAEHSELARERVRVLVRVLEPGTMRLTSLAVSVIMSCFPVASFLRRAPRKPTQLHCGKILSRIVCLSASSGWQQYWNVPNAAQFVSVHKKRSVRNAPFQIVRSDMRFSTASFVAVDANDSNRSRGRTRTCKRRTRIRVRLAAGRELHVSDADRVRVKAPDAASRPKHGRTRTRCRSRRRRTRRLRNRDLALGLVSATAPPEASASPVLRSRSSSSVMSRRTSSSSLSPPLSSALRAAFAPRDPVGVCDVGAAAARFAGFVGVRACDMSSIEPRRRVCASDSDTRYESNSKHLKSSVQPRRSVPRNPNF